MTDVTFDPIQIDPDFVPTQTTKLTPQKKKLLAQFFAAMKARGVTAVRVEFRGEGDSGGMEDVHFKGLHGEDVPLNMLAVLDNEIDVSNGQIMGEGGKWVNNYTKRIINNLEEFAMEVGNAIATTDAHDWWNNDGGQGHVIFYYDDKGDHVQLYIGINETVVSDNFIGIE